MEDELRRREERGACAVGDLGRQVHGATCSGHARPPKAMPRRDRGTTRQQGGCAERLAVIELPSHLADERKASRSAIVSFAADDGTRRCLHGIVDRLRVRTRTPDRKRGQRRYATHPDGPPNSTVRTHGLLLLGSTGDRAGGCPMVITGRRTPNGARFAVPWVSMPGRSARGAGWLLRIERGSAKVSMQPQASCVSRDRRPCPRTPQLDYRGMPRRFEMTPSPCRDSLRACPPRSAPTSAKPSPR
jgi:hypothetical protein